MEDLGIEYLLERVATCFRLARLAADKAQAENLRRAGMVYAVRALRRGADPDAVERAKTGQHQ